MIKINASNKQSLSMIKNTNFSDNFEQDVMNKIKEYNNDLFDLSEETENLQYAKTNTDSDIKYSAKNPLLDFNPQLELMRIAAAENISSLKRVILSLENRVAMLKNVKEAETLIPKIKRILKKGYQKVGKLEIETKIERAAKKAHRRREYVKESSHRSRLAFKKIQRKKQEMEDVKNANNIANGCEENVPQLNVIASDYINSQTISAETAVVSAAVETAISSIENNDTISESTVDVSV